LSLQKGNVILREFYLQRYLEIHGDRGAFPSSVASKHSRSDPLAEKFVDWHVEQFLSRVQENMEGLKSRLVELESARREALGQAEKISPEDRQRLKGAAGEVANDAAKLLRMISMVMWNVRADGSEASEVRASSAFLEAEVSFLRVQVEKAEESLNDLFLQPSHTVTVRELRGDNLPSQLKAIEVMSKQIVKRL
jgi:chromosome segregation ATPase